MPGSSSSKSGSKMGSKQDFAFVGSQFDKYPSISYPPAKLDIGSSSKSSSKSSSSTMDSFISGPSPWSSSNRRGDTKKRG